MRGSKMKHFLKSTIITILTCFLSPITFALENLEPIANDRLLIDGYLEDWNQMRRQSAEYLLKGTIANMEDFQGGLKVAYNKDWLYLGIDCKDSDLQGNRSSDQVTVSLQGKNKEKASIDFYLKKKRQNRKAKKAKANKMILFKAQSKKDKIIKLNDVYYFKYRFNRASQSAVVVKSQFTSNGYTIEAKIPMSILPWIYGAEVKLAAIFRDRDDDGADSVYSTHIVNGRGAVDQVSYIFGGAQLFKLVYEEDAPPFKVIKELAHDWIGDQRNELLLVTDSEIVLFGDAIKSDTGYVRYIHGWTSPQKTRVSISGQKASSELKVELLKKDGSVSRVERFKLQGGQLIKQ